MADHKGLVPHLMRNTVGGAVGNILEWYDFAVFGYFAPVIGSQFIPSEDKLALRTSDSIRIKQTTSESVEGCTNGLENIPESQKP